MTLGRCQNWWRQYLNIHLLTRPIWKYVKPISFATSGIYSNSNLDLLRNHMFPVEKLSMLITIAAGVNAYQKKVYRWWISQTRNHSTNNAERRNTLLEELHNIRISRRKGLIVFIIVQLIKLIIDTIIYRYAVHSIYGCGIHLLAAI